MIYLFDLDNTLISTDRIKDRLYSLAERHGYSAAEAKEIYAEARTIGTWNTISLARYAEVLQDHLQRDGKAYHTNLEEEVRTSLEHDNNLLLPGVEKFLQNCLVKQVRKILLSLGATEWQQEKIRWSGLDKYFSAEHGEIVFTQLEGEGKIEAIKHIFGDEFEGAGIVLFNDKPDETREILTAFPKMRAQVRRETKDYRYNEADFMRLREDFGDRLEVFEDWSLLGNREGIEGGLVKL